MELRKSIPFRYRVAVGVGFFAVGLAGWMGAFKEAGAAASASFSATSADWNDNKSAAGAYMDSRAHHQVNALVDFATANMSLAASAWLMQGAWRRIMRVDGRWVHEVLAAEQAEPVQAETTVAATDAAHIAAPALAEVVALGSTSQQPAAEVVDNVYYVQFGGRDEAV